MEKMAAFLYSLIVLLLLAGGSAAAQTAPPLIVFGDSTVDTGNNNYINTTLDFSVNVPPYGQQFFGKPTGRFSNGRIFVDFICEHLGIPYTSPYLQPGADHGKGVNFASGGSGVLDETNGGLVVSLGAQLKYFTEFQEATYEKLGSHQAKQYFSDAIYMISIANNDYMSGYFSIAKLREDYAPQEFVLLIVSKLVGACEFLYSKGARKIVVFEVGPLGCVPALRLYNPTQGCFQPAAELGLAHNMALRMALGDWQSKHADVTILVAGLHQFMLERINDPTAFGYTEGVSACCGSGPLRGAGHCGRLNPLTGEEHHKCDNPEDYVFWDFYHGTETMHQQFGEMLWDGPAPVTAPLNLRQLVDLSSSPDCDDEQLAAYSSGPANPVDVHIEHSSF